MDTSLRDSILELVFDVRMDLTGRLDMLAATQTDTNLDGSNDRINQTIKFLLGNLMNRSAFSTNGLEGTTVRG